MNTWLLPAVHANRAATRPVTTRPSSGLRPGPCTGRGPRGTHGHDRGRRWRRHRNSLPALPQPGRPARLPHPRPRSSRLLANAQAAQHGATDGGRSAPAIHRGSDQPAQRPRPATARRTAVAVAEDPCRSRADPPDPAADHRPRAAGRHHQSGCDPRATSLSSARCSLNREGPDPGWDMTCRRLLATYLAGLGVASPGPA